MALIPNLESANNSNFLWPSISDAVDTFLRRRHGNADAYERVWRLIHIWEATSITLGLAAMSRVIDQPSNSAIFKRQREFFYGRTWEEVTGSFRSGQGAADGAIDQWINILDEIAKATTLNGQFLSALKKFLTSDTIEMGQLLASWSKACDVPAEFKKKTQVEVRAAMRYVNSFRNRLAHVPFPHDPLEEVSDALEAATEQLFSTVPLPTSHEKAGESSALTGAIRIKRCFLHGACTDYTDGIEEEIQFVFPCKRKGENIELWSARSLLHFDAMNRPHILTRVKGLDVCEYTRFRAEANAVLVKPNAGISTRLPEPTKAEYITAEPEPAKDEPLPNLISGPTVAEAEPKTIQATSMSEANEAIRSGEFDSAIEFYEKLTRETPNYHIGWLRLGYAKREKAVRIAVEDPTASISLLQASMSDLEKAAEHIYPEFQAQSWYERSKSAYHFKRLFPKEFLDGDVWMKDAEKACSISNENKYITWWEHIQLWPPTTPGSN